MRHPLRVWLTFAFAGAITGCNLEFVDVDLEGPSQLDLVVDVNTDVDSIRIVGRLVLGMDDSGRRRAVLSDLQVEGQSLRPQDVAEQEWRWNASLPASVAAGGHLMILPPYLHGLETPRQIVIHLPSRDGSREIDIASGEQIELRFAFPQAPADADWQLRVLDADGSPDYVATSRNLPSGAIVIPEGMLPATVPGSYRAELDVLTSRLDEPEPGQYSVKVRAHTHLSWILRQE